MKKLTSIILFCFCFIITIKAQSTVLLKGTIGTYPIVMELNMSGDTAAYATYFYESKKKNIELDGNILKDGTISIICYNNHDEKFDYKSEKLELKKSNNGYIGNWITTKKTLPVNLTPFSLEEIKNPFAQYPGIQKLKKDNPLDYARSAGLQFIKDSATKTNGFFLDWYHEKYSHIKLFRLRKEIMSEAIKKVNQQLEEIQLKESNSQLTCTSPRGETDFEQQVHNIFLNNDLLSVNLSTSYDCGGAHPDFGSVGYSFDLHTGILLHLDDIMWFGKAKPPEEDSEKWYGYRDSVFAPKLTNILKQLYPKQMKKRTATDDDCDYSNPEIWDFPNWYFTRKGLYVGAYFARVARACDEPEWSIIPYKIVRKYLSSSMKIKLPE